MFNFKNLHIGLTNRCRLLCPECPRNEPGAKYIHSMFDMEPDLIKKFLVTCEPETILFCGNWGDPIYAKNFIELLEDIKLKFSKCKIFIHTNGSGKNVQWWEHLMSVLNDNDNLIFSIDGLPHNYNLYRINSQWEDVKTAVDTCISTKKKLNKNTKVIWKYLAFSYNQDDINEAYKLSKEIGFNDFWLQESYTTPEHAWLKITTEFHELYEKLMIEKNEESRSFL
jgi:MoaA/NifB/PqqE/SkfB family radical SAM enzyme